MNNKKSYKAIYNCKIFSYSYRFILFFFLILLFSSFKVLNTNSSKEIKIDPISSFDEVPVEFLVDGYLSFETDVIITDTKRVYINIEGLFKNLGISCSSTNNGDFLFGFIEKESKKYTIDVKSHEINIENNTIKSVNGIVKELGGVYIESTIITEVFGLNIIFNYRSLSIKLESNFELPLVKQMRLEKMRQNISKLQDKEIVADTILKRDYHLFKGGMLDWSLASYQTENETTGNRIGLGVGTELLYGQANISVNYDNLYKFNNRQLYYNWRWVDDTKKYIKQAEVGKIYSQSISFLEAPVVGVTINNSPNTVRKASGYHTINEYTEPNWTIELYINDNLVDYTVADASGLYVFKVPIVYGYTVLKFKFYGPLGEVRIEERTMNVPFTFMPAKTLEYSVSGGVLEDGKSSKFGRGVVNYGVNKFVTVGGGFEYLSSIPNKPFIPFATVAIQPFSKLILNVEYAHDVRIESILNYNFGKSSFLEIDYAKYVDGQLATRFNAKEERKIRLSLPFRRKRVSGYAKLNYNQYVYDAFNYNQFDASFSGYYKNFNANASTLLNWVGSDPAYITSTLALSYRLRSGLILRPSFEYNISDNQFLRYRAEIEKRVAKMYFSASYEKNTLSKTDNVFLSFRYDLSFARTGFTSSYSNNRFAFSENVQGSMAFSAGNGSTKSSYNSALGKGGILFYPFLDLNQNGKRDKDEQMVLLSYVKVNGGKAEISKKNSIVRVSDLNAFINYDITFFDDDLDNISWRFKHKTYQVLVDPNQYKRVDVPILSVGEVSGMVILNKENTSKGQGRITIQIFNKKGNKVAETLSERDGYYSYLGLNPGEYYIRVDEKQLKKLGYISSPLVNNATIKVLVDGDIIDGLDFELNSIDTKISKKAQLKMVSVDTLSQKTKLDESFYSVQMGVFNNKLASKQLSRFPSTFYEVLPNGKFRYFTGKYSSLEKAVNTKNGLMLKGIKGGFVVAFKNGKIANNKLFSEKRESETNVIDFLEKISNIEGEFFSVQIGVFRKQVTLKQLLNLSPIFYEVLPDSTTRYIAGKYDLLKKAKIARNKIIAKGVTDAYVVAYKEGKQIKVAVLDNSKKQYKIATGEIHGLVTVKNTETTLKSSVLLLNLWNEKGEKVAKTYTNNKGDFSFLELKPGAYTIRLDEELLKKNNQKSIPKSQEVVIKPTVNGAIIKGMDFGIIKIKN